MKFAIVAPSLAALLDREFSAETMLPEEDEEVAPAFHTHAPHPRVRIYIYMND